MDCNNPPVGRIIGMVSNLLRRVMDKKFTDVPYSGVETACIGYIMGRLNQNPDAQIFQKDIEKEFNLRSPTASEMIKNMENKGLIHRENIEGDGRKKKLIPSQKGMECNSEIMFRLNEIEEILTKDISKEELETYRRVSKKMIENLRMGEING